MSEGNLIEFPPIDVPEIGDEALITVSGGMSCNKTATAVSMAWDLVDGGHEVLGLRPEQDTRHSEPYIIPKNEEIDPFPAFIVPSLGELATVGHGEIQIAYFDEPHFWAIDPETGTPDPESVKAVEHLLSVGARVLVSTLNKNYKEEEIPWLTELRRMGADLPSGAFLDITRTGFCELCPRDDLASRPPGPSVSTNYYVNRIKQTSGDSNIVEGPDDSSHYVPCCEDCRENPANDFLDEDFEYLEDFLKAA